MALSPQDAARTHAAMRCAPSPQPSILPSDFRLHHHTHPALRATHGSAYIRSVAPWQVALLLGCALTASSPCCRHSRRSLRGAAGRWFARPQCPISGPQEGGRPHAVACLQEDALLCARRRSARCSRTTMPRSPTSRRCWTVRHCRPRLLSRLNGLARLRAVSDICFAFCYVRFWL